MSKILTSVSDLQRLDLKILSMAVLLLLPSALKAGKQCEPVFADALLNSNPTPVNSDALEIEKYRLNQAAKDIDARKILQLDELYFFLSKQDQYPHMMVWNKKLNQYRTTYQEELLSIVLNKGETNHLGHWTLGKDPSDRIKAIFIISKLFPESPKTHQGLVKALSDPNQAVRDYAAHGLLKISKQHKLQGAVDGLELLQAVNDKNIWVRIAALNALGRTALADGRITRALTDSFKDENDNVVLEALKSFKESFDLLDDKERLLLGTAVEPLLPLLSHKNWMVQDRALQVFTHLLKSRNFALIKKHLAAIHIKTSDQNETIRFHAEEALLELASKAPFFLGFEGLPPELSDFYLNYLNNPDQKTRITAMKGLQFLADNSSNLSAVNKVLLDLLNDGSYLDKLMALDTIRTLNRSSKNLELGLQLAEFMKSTKHNWLQRMTGYKFNKEQADLSKVVSFTILSLANNSPELITALKKVGSAEAEDLIKALSKLPPSKIESTKPRDQSASENMKTVNLAEQQGPLILKGDSSYLGVDVVYDFFPGLVEKLQKKFNLSLKTRGEAHLTVINSVELSKIKNILAKKYPQNAHILSTIFIKIIDQTIWKK